MQMRKPIALSALVLTGVTFLVAAGCSLPRAPVDISGVLKLTMIASGAGFMLTVVVCVFVAWPVQKGDEAKKVKHPKIRDCHLF